MCKKGGNGSLIGPSKVRMLPNLLGPARNGGPGLLVRL